MAGQPNGRETQVGSGPDFPLAPMLPGTGEGVPELFVARPASMPARLAFAASLRAVAARDAATALLRREADLGTAFHFVPVALALGIAAYFAAPYEPAWPAPLVAVALFGGLALRMRVHGGLFHLLCALALIAAGMSAAQWRTVRSSTPVIAAGITTELAGVVVDVSQNRRGNPRYLIRPVSVSGLDPAALPPLVRLSAASRHAPLLPGDSVAGRVRLQPFNGPALPGGYDFGFFQWFDGLGATGWFLGPPAPGPSEALATGFSERVTVAVNRLRLAIAQRLRAGLPGEEGDIAVALITGDRTGLDEDTQESLRASGLAHILAISGLHMALVTLAVVNSARFLLSLSPGMALRRPVRKWAAATGFAAASAYLLISGGAVATQRAYVMIAVMLFATLIDRRAITMRNVAIAAIIILLATPEALLEPGFQMSFAAASALVAAYGAVTEARRRRWQKREMRNAGQGLAARVVGHIAGLGFTSLVAGLATGIFAAWHFHRIAPLGLLANLLAMPVVGFLVMPLSLIAMLLMPFGFEGLLLWALGPSIAAVVAVSDWVNGFPAPSVTGLQGQAVLLLGAVGLVLLVALRTRLRLLGLLPIAALAVTVQGARAPDLAISQEGSAIAMRDHDGRLALLYPRRNRFVTGIWLRAWSGDEAGDAATLDAACDKDYCRATSPKGVRVVVVFAPKRIAEACGEADVLAAPRLRWVRCPDRKPELVLKREDFERGGTHLIRFDGPPSRRKFTVTTSLGAQDRPWNAARIPTVTDEFSSGG